MRTYIISVAAATVISAIVTMLSPRRWEKYISVVTGLVVTVCIASPIITLTRSDIFAGWSESYSSPATGGDSLLREEIKKEPEKRLSEDASARLKSEFGLRSQAMVSVRVGKDNAIEGVSSIKIYGQKPDAVVIGRLYEVYDAGEVKYAGTEKTIEKPE